MDCGEERCEPDCAETHQMSLAATWISRGLFTCDVICPKVDEPTEPFGAPNCGVFSRLNASPRSCSFSRSSDHNGKFLNRAKSRLWMPSWRIFGRVLPTFPNVNAGCGAKQEVLNHSLMRLTAEPPRAAPFGQTCRRKLGREPPPLSCVAVGEVSSIGKPV